VLGETREQALEAGREYLQQVLATCPYDYLVTPATSADEYQHLSGANLLAQSNLQLHLLQVRRQEVPLRLSGNAVALSGSWTSTAHADELIWRAMAHCTRPALLHLLLAPAIVLEEERQALLNLNQAWKHFATNGQAGMNGLETLLDQYVERYSHFAQKYYHMQVHILTTPGVDTHLAAAVGTVLTRPVNNAPLPGYMLVESGPQDAQSWAWRLAHLEFNTAQPVSAGLERLRDLADLNEMMSVFRLPYPPGSILSDLNFI
jgi:hypothetical protein